MKVTLVLFLITVIYNVNVFGLKQSLRSSDTVPHYVRCGKGDYRCSNDKRDLIERLAYGRHAEENDRCGCGKGDARNRHAEETDRCGCGKGDARNRHAEETDRCGCIKGEARNRHAEENDRCGCGKGDARNRIQKNSYDDDRCNCFGFRSERSRDICNCGGKDVAHCQCDTKPTMLYIEESDSSEISAEAISDETDGGETPQVITELLHEYGRDFLMIGKVLSEVARRSNYIGAANDGYVTFDKGCPPGEVKTLYGNCVSERDLRTTTSTSKPTTKKSK